jgi:hypothetical protein
VNLSWTHFRELFLEEQLRLRHASNAPRARKRALAWDVTRGGGAERTRPRTDTIG